MTEGVSGAGGAIDYNTAGERIGAVYASDRRTATAGERYNYNDGGYLKQLDTKANGATVWTS